MYIITFIIIFNYGKNHLIKILSSLIVKFSSSQELLQVKCINCYLREIISFTTKMTLETGASLSGALPSLFQLCTWGQKWACPRGQMFYIGLYREKHEKIFLSETIRPRALIFGILHHPGPLAGSHEIKGFS